jgi:hypothetical protein
LQQGLQSVWQGGTNFECGDGLHGVPHAERRAGGAGKIDRDTGAQWGGPPLHSDN